LTWARGQLSPCPPIILITSRDDEADIVGALEAGADDYIIKPAAPTVVAARIAAVLRRAYPETAAIAGIETLHGARFDHGADTVHIGDVTTVLTAREFALALALFHNLNRPLSRSYLLETVWGRNPDLATRTLETHVSRLRVKLRLRPENGYRLLPVYSFGYRLERLDDASEAA
jgi:DNA-binding response OmpR family regulator